MSTEITPSTSTRPRYVARPPVDIYESDEGLLLRADLPGVEREGLNLRLEQGVLTISARRLLGTDPQGPFAEYLRRFHVPRDTDPAQIGARLEAGVLTVELPKTDAAKPRVIQVQTD